MRTFLQVIKLIRIYTLPTFSPKCQSFLVRHARIKDNGFFPDTPESRITAKTQCFNKNHYFKSTNKLQQCNYKNSII